MIQAQPAPQFIFRWPKALTLQPYRALERYQVQKVAAVAIASLLFFGVQFYCSWALSGGIALSCSVITLLSETFLRKENIENVDWFSRDINKKQLMIQVAFRLAILPIILSLQIAFGTTPVQAIASHILNGNLRMILLVILVAPVAEEILFRGFIQERTEDLLNLVDRYIHRLSEPTKKYVSIALQAPLFGTIHIVGAQVANRSMKVLVFCMTSLLGAVLAWIKVMEESLLPPLVLHSAQNTGVVLGLLAGRVIRQMRT